MINKSKFKLGILAYGSLIDDPGEEINEIIEQRIECDTPFKVEFARKSKTRGCAPTLIPYDTPGRSVKAMILILPDNTPIDKAKSMLWRRERREKNKAKTYKEPVNPGINEVVIKNCHNFMDVETVLYTSLGNNINQPLNGKTLAYLAKKSILSKAGQEKMDGLRYLVAAKKNGIKTALSEEYEKQILLETETSSLEEAIEMLDRERMKTSSDNK